MSKTGLVLEGGAMRGLYTAAILDVMSEQHLQLDGMIGVSAGATFGCNFKSGQPGRTMRYNLRFCRNWHYASWRSWLLTGDLYGAKFCYDDIPHDPAKMKEAYAVGRRDIDEKLLQLKRFLAQKSGSN